MPSDKFHLNGVRIDRPALDKFPVLVAEGLGLSQRHAFLLQRKIVQALQAPAISHGKSLAVVLTGEFEPSDYWDLLDSEGLKGYTKELTTFGQQTFKMRRRLLGAVVGHHGRQQNIFQEGFLAFYEYTQNGSVFHKSLRITVLEDVEYYRLFLEPGCNVLYPLISLDPEMVMGQGRNLRVLEIPPSDDRWGGGFLGFLIGVEEPSVINEREEFFLIEVNSLASNAREEAKPHIWFQVILFLFSHPMSFWSISIILGDYETGRSCAHLRDFGKSENGIRSCFPMICCPLAIN
jgi:hypothetical protein